ncbi:unnamed protein product, partial [Ectocarpus sp. 12 AP-2014]
TLLRHGSQKSGSRHLHRGGGSCHGLTGSPTLASTAGRRTRTAVPRDILGNLLLVFRWRLSVRPSRCANSGDLPFCLPVQVRGIREVDQPTEGVGVDRFVDDRRGHNNLRHLCPTLQTRLRMPLLRGYHCARNDDIAQRP